MRRNVRYSIGFELDENLDICRVPRAYVLEPRRNEKWKSWRDVFTHHRYVTDYETYQQGSLWLRRMS